MEKYGITRKIKIRTAQRFLRSLSYWFVEMKCGHGDLHEQSDIVHYCDHVYLPAWATLQKQMRKFSHENLPEMGPYMEGQCVVIWYHDKSIFYAHDHQHRTWFHKDAPAQAQPKGDGLSLMVSDLVSADFGWLRSPDGSEDAWVVFRPGKNCDGYMTAVEVED